MSSFSYPAWTERGALGVRLFITGSLLQKQRERAIVSWSFLKTHTFSSSSRLVLRATGRCESAGPQQVEEQNKRVLTRLMASFLRVLPVFLELVGTDCLLLLCGLQGGLLVVRPLSGSVGSRSGTYCSYMTFCENANGFHTEL